MRAAFLIAVWAAVLSGCIEKEGDFNIEMPRPQGVSQSDVERDVVALHIHLEADDQGNLAGVVLGDLRIVAEQDQDTFGLLNRAIREIVEEQFLKDDTPREYEAVVHADPDLNHAVVIKTITAVSGSIDTKDEIRPLVARIRFAPPHGTEADSAAASSNGRP